MRNKTGLIIFLLTVSAWGIGGIVLLQNEQNIVIHWNNHGQADGYGPRWLLLLFPLMIPLIDTLLRFCRRIDPKRHNYAKFASSFTTLRVTVALLLWICCMITSAEAWQPGITNVSMLICFSIGGLVSICGNIMPRIRPNYMIGIRNPWTLHDESIWRKTHRIGGWIWFGGGILLCVLSLWQLEFMIFNAWILFIILVPNLYSYVLYRRSASG